MLPPISSSSEAELKSGGGKGISIKGGQMVEAGTVDKGNIESIKADKAKVAYENAIASGKTKEEAQEQASTARNAVHSGDTYTRTLGERDGKVVATNVNTERTADSKHSALQTQRTGSSKINEDVDMTEMGRGTNVKIGMAPMTMAVTTGNAQFVAGQYDGLLSGKGPTVGGVSLVNETADMVGGYGKLQQSLQDYAGAVASGQVAFNANKIPMIGGVLDKLGIDLSAKGGAETAKKALETMDVNTFKMAFQESYINDISKNPSVSEQAKQIAGMGHEMYSMMKEYGGKGTLGQLTSSVPNLLKDQADAQKAEASKESLSKETRQATDNVTGVDFIGMPKNEK